MTEHAPRDRSKRQGRTILFAAGIVTGLALLLLWSWNTLAVDLFKMPTAQFKHAFALEVFLLAAFVMYHTARRLFGFNRNKEVIPWH